MPGWLIGLVLGLLVGSAAFDAAGALFGAIVGTLVGRLMTRQSAGAATAGAATAGGGDGERLRLLESQVAWLYRETQALRGEIEMLRGGVANGAVPPAATPMPMPEAAPPTPPREVAVEGIAVAASVAPAATPGDLSPPPETAPEPPPRAAERPEPAAWSAPVATAEAQPGWLARLMAGNPLAKIGVVLLFFGVASALKLAAEAGLFPPSLRLLLAAIGGLALIGFGFVKSRPADADDADAAPGRRNFGLALQGGGFALLYLVVYFMLARYAMIGHGLAFALFGLLGVACVILAARLDGPALAVLGLSGAFLAPVMAGGRADTPLPLFAYFALLNAFILTVDWFRAWRVLNIAGFLFTLVIGMAWALDGYRPEHYGVTQGFLILFLLMYSATPVATALLRAPGEEAWREGVLIFGTPLLGAALQYRLVHPFEHGAAWSALIGSLYYFALWGLMFRRGSDAVRILERSHLGIALALFTVTIPLAFDAQVTSAFWAAEGAAVLWFGVRQRRRLAQGTGLAMQLIAGGAFVDAWPRLGHNLPLLNDVAIGGMLLAGAGLTCARLLRRLEAAEGEGGLPAALPALWALAWWLGIGLVEIDRFVPNAEQVPAVLLFVMLTVLALEGLGRHWQWPWLRQTGVLLLPVLWLATAGAIDRGGHPLAGLMLPVLPLAFVVHYRLLAWHEDALASGAMPAVAWPGARHLGAWWLGILALALELAWLAQRLAPDVSLWPLLAWGVAPSLGLAIAGLATARGMRPWAAQAALYRGLGSLPPALALMLWSLLANATHAGGGSGLPYLPLLNLFDLAQLAAFAVLWRAGDAEARRRLLRPAVLGLAFVWATALAARIAHHWGGVPFTGTALFGSSLCQALVTFLWTVLAIGTMIRAARTGARSHWFGGFGLLAVVGAKLLMVDLANSGTVVWTGSLLGVALLVLAAGYFAPVPPKPAD